MMRVNGVSDRGKAALRVRKCAPLVGSRRCPRISFTFDTRVRRRAPRRFDCSVFFHCKRSNKNEQFLDRVCKRAVGELQRPNPLRLAALVSQSGDRNTGKKNGRTAHFTERRVGQREMVAYCRARPSFPVGALRTNSTDRAPSPQALTTGPPPGTSRARAVGRRSVATGAGSSG